MAGVKGKVPPQFLPGYKKKGATNPILPPVSGAPSAAPLPANPMQPSAPPKQKSLFKKHPVGGYNM